MKHTFYHKRNEHNFYSPLST